MAYLLFALIYDWTSTSSTAQAILFIAPNFIADAAIMTWLARRTS